MSILVARYPKKKGKNLSYQISIVRVGERNAPTDVGEESVEVGASAGGVDHMTNCKEVLRGEREA